jgi:hypothetical protein
MPMLWPGAMGPAVRNLQAKLIEFGYDPGSVDGVYGRGTAAAVTSFQRDQELKPDGIAGPRTFGALHLIKTTPDARNPIRTKVFVSYSHCDERWLDRLMVFLKPLERDGIVDLWSDRKIAPGKKWLPEITNAVRSAKVAVLLISADFMASDFIAIRELPPLLKAAENDGILILPVIISPCVLGPLEGFQAVNSPDEPMVDLRRGDRERVWKRVVEAITAALNEN